MIAVICGITPGALDVADEDVAVGAERDDALLDPRAAGVVDADHRRADLGGQVHDLAHLLRHHLAERAAEDREVLAEDEHRAAVDRPVAGDHGVAPGALLVHVELVGAVADEGVELLERARVEQLLDPLAGGQLALRVLLLDRLLGGGVDRLLAQLPQVGELLLVGLGVLLAHGARILDARRCEAYALSSTAGSGRRRAPAAASSACAPSVRRGGVRERPARRAGRQRARRAPRPSPRPARPPRASAGGQRRLAGAGGADQPGLDRDPLAGHPLGAAAVEALARAQQPAADVLGDPGAAHEPVAGLVVRSTQRPAPRRSRSRGRLRGDLGRRRRRARPRAGPRTSRATSDCARSKPSPTAPAKA